MKKIIFFYLLFAVIASATSHAYEYRSFSEFVDCEKDTKYISLNDSYICRHSELTKLNKELLQKYKEVLQKWNTSELSWEQSRDIVYSINHFMNEMEARRNRCSDVECIKENYNKTMTTLNKAIKSNKFSLSDFKMRLSSLENLFALSLYDGKSEYHEKSSDELLQSWDELEKQGVVKKITYEDALWFQRIGVVCLDAMKFNYGKKEYEPHFRPHLYNRDTSTYHRYYNKKLLSYILLQKVKELPELSGWSHHYLFVPNDIILPLGVSITSGEMTSDFRKADMAIGHIMLVNADKEQIERFLGKARVPSEDNIPLQISTSLLNCQHPYTTREESLCSDEEIRQTVAELDSLFKKLEPKAPEIIQAFWYYARHKLSQMTRFYDTKGTLKVLADWLNQNTYEQFSANNKEK